MILTCWRCHVGVLVHYSNWAPTGQPASTDSNVRGPSWKPSPSESSDACNPRQYMHTSTGDTPWHSIRAKHLTDPQRCKQNTCFKLLNFRVTCTVAIAKRTLSNLEFRSWGRMRSRTPPMNMQYGQETNLCCFRSLRLWFCYCSTNYLLYLYTWQIFFFSLALSLSVLLFKVHLS